MGLQVFQRHDAAWRRQVDQNTAQLAWSHAFYDSTGWGELTVEDPVEFDVTFAQPPAVSYGYYLTDEDTELVSKRWPRGWGFVVGWKRTTRGFYTGAHIAIVVDNRSAELIAGMPSAIPSYGLTHCFVFSGLALKNIDEDLFDE